MVLRGWANIHEVNRTAHDGDKGSKMLRWGCLELRHNSTPESPTRNVGPSLGDPAMRTMES